MLAGDHLLCSRYGMKAIGNKIKNGGPWLLPCGIAIFVCVNLGHTNIANLLSIVSLSVFAFASSEDKPA